MLQTTPPTTHPHVEPTDGELLFRFVGEKSEEAFRRLVDRHARLVVSVCRRVLWHDQDVEDAFQATFLVLVRRAGGLRRRDSVAAWLFQVARRIALRASDRRRRDATAADDADSAATGGTPLDRLQDREEFEILATELERLPESYRLPLVLHYLEGQSRAATAEQLDCTEATVKARLARGRRLLRRRLMRRGVALSVAFGALAIPTTTQAGLVAATTSAAVHQATGGATGSAASTGSLTLAQGLPTMLALPAAKATGIVGTTLAASLLVAVGVALSQPPEGRTAAGSDGPATTVDSRVVSSDPVEATNGLTVVQAGNQPAPTGRDEWPNVDDVDPARSVGNAKVIDLLNALAKAKLALEESKLNEISMRKQLEDLKESNARSGRRGSPAIDMKSIRPNEQRIASALSEETHVQFIDIPLSEGIEFFSDLHKVPIVIDVNALDDEGIPLDEPITLSISGVSFESGLNLVLDPLGLTYVIEDEVMKVTSKTVAETKQEIRVYPVGTLVDAGLLEAETMAELLLQQETGKAVTSVRVVTITQSQAAHRRTRELLEQMHRAVPAEEE